MRQGVLDGALISGLELEVAEGLNRREVELVKLGELSLALGCCAEAPVLVGGVPEVLVPDGGVAPGLRQLLRELNPRHPTGSAPDAKANVRNRCEGAPTWGAFLLAPFSPSPQHGLHPRGSQPFREAVTAHYKDAYREAGGRVDVGFSEGAIEVNGDDDSGHNSQPEGGAGGAGVGSGALYRQRPQGDRRGAV